MKATVSTKGQIVIPKEIRDHHRLSAGSRVEVEDRGDVIILRPTRPAKRYTVDDLLALPKYYQGPALSVDQMAEAVDAELRARWSTE